MVAKRFAKEERFSSTKPSPVGSSHGKFALAWEKLNANAWRGASSWRQEQPREMQGVSGLDVS
jgi:hypothetical protein